jgi:hypothetical protein
VLEQDLDFIARLELGHVLELLERDGALGFEADIEHHHVVADLEDPGLHDLALVDGGEGALVEFHHPLVFGGRVLVLVVEFGAPVRERAKNCLLLLAAGHDVDGRGGGIFGHDSFADYPRRVEEERYALTRVTGFSRGPAGPAELVNLSDPRGYFNRATDLRAGSRARLGPGRPSCQS